MANCVRCGRELTEGHSEAGVSLCSDCRNAVMNDPNFRAQVPSPAPASQSGPRARTVARRQPVTLLLVGINVAVFALMLLRGVPLLSPTGEQVLAWGANFGPLSLGAQPWRIFTSNYVHFGIIHIFFNMWCLWNLGGLAENIFEPWTYLLVYTASGIAGSLVSLWWHPMVVGAGASGAIFGLAGALIAALYLGKLPIPKAAIRHTLKSLLSFAGYNLFFGSVVRGIDNSAHFGGLFAGLICGVALSQHLMVLPQERRRSRNVIFVVATLFLLTCGVFVKRRFESLSLAQYGVAGPQGDSSGAVPESQDAVRRNPNSPEANFLLGRAYLRAQQPDAALASFQEALRLKPDYAQAEAGLALAYAAKGMKEEAQQALKKAAELRDKQKK